MLSSARAAMPLLDPPADAPGRGIVDQLIAERAPRLLASPAGRWLLARVLCPLLSYREAVALAELVRPMPGRAIFRLLEELLEIRTLVSGIEHLPAIGPAILVANHPTGLADGIAVVAALRRRRDDLWFLANADALRVAPGLSELIVPVEWVQAKRSHAKTRELLAAVGRLLGEGRALVIFPSGRLSYLSWRGLAERPWQAAAVGLARRFDVPVVPMQILARNSALFYLLSQLGKELRDITLFHELLDKRGRTFELRLAAPLEAAELDGEPLEVAIRLQRFVEAGLRDRRLLLPPRAIGKHGTTLPLGPRPAGH
ncbi:MAG: 1-acyl-sn-glycerol-3-phosphate acyltransferase [Geminicoccaceae bacterium]|nr:1-acyl-sn-glycerol-3-phosphate acyltransferase [Geminicoccaceae bacterium]MCX8099692.1 1-acyl-sn-glycerol-3-phosphate acyltransferase [Geminicoccaceae bacterium]MDW8369997.1 1-acyl-sn-glycerol-3-phosphate acyltransferase [Geminicoccaceae bacterium]